MQDARRHRAFKWCCLSDEVWYWGSHPSQPLKGHTSLECVHPCAGKTCLQVSSWTKWSHAIMQKTKLSGLSILGIQSETGIINKGKHSCDVRFPKYIQKGKAHRYYLHKAVCNIGNLISPSQIPYSAAAVSETCPLCCGVKTGYRLCWHTWGCSTRLYAINVTFEFWNTRSES